MEKITDSFVLIEEKSSGLVYVTSTIKFCDDTKRDIINRVKNEIDTKDFKVLRIITEEQANNYHWY